MIASLQLPLYFDAEALAADLTRVEADEWISHFNTGNYSGDWSGVALRGPAGATHPIQSLFATPGTKDWEDAELLQSCDYFRQVLSRFECPLQSVRLLRLGPGAMIKKHVDHSLSLEDGEVRLHIPVRTSPDVEFYLDGARLGLEVGQTWYLNVNLPHRVTNGGTEYRVHMVLDCEVNDWLRSLFEPRRSGEGRAKAT